MVQPLLIASKTFRWNISRQVGFGRANAIDDVELVRFAYRMMAINPRTERGTPLFEKLSKLKSSGAFGPDLDEVIIAHQKSRGGTQDRCVSPEVDNGRVESYDGAHTWIMAALGNNMIDITKGFFPRIDLHEASGPQLKKAVLLTFALEK